ncbi:hypothetical protein BV900_14925 [Agrobacterium tumefaciens]|nr:hypothetical protein BV900_14925 [Agrobacterium tumefaciens]
MRSWKSRPRRIGEIVQDIERLQPTLGDAFNMTVLGQDYTEHEEARRALMKKILTLLRLQQEGEVHLATIGGFDLVYKGERIGKGDGYRYDGNMGSTGSRRNNGVIVNAWKRRNDG